MLIVTFTILGIAVLLGALLAVLRLRGARAKPPPWAVAALHGFLGVGGLICLLLVLRGPSRGLETGTASFGVIAAWLVALAALIGVGLLAMRLRGRRLSGLLIGAHATLAIGGFVILAAYIFAG